MARKTYDQTLAEFRSNPQCVEQVQHYMIAALEGTRQLALVPKTTRIKVKVISTDPATVERWMVEMLKNGCVDVLTIADKHLEPLN